MKNELYEKWDDILENMKTEFEISAPIYRTFVKTLSIYHVEGNKLTVLIDDVKIETVNPSLNRDIRCFWQSRLKSLLGFNMIFLSYHVQN